MRVIPITAEERYALVQALTRPRLRVRLNTPTQLTVVGLPELEFHVHPLDTVEPITSHKESP